MVKKDIPNDRVDLNRLQNFPISFFAVVLGMAGFTLAVQKAEEILLLPFEASFFLLVLTGLLFILIGGIYLVKLIKFPKLVREEFNHPVKMNFFPILAKVLLILSIIFLEIQIDYSRWLWYLGTGLQFIFTFSIFSVWVRHTKFDIIHINPAWFIPVVGNIIVPIAGIQHASPELLWFFFSAGFGLWVMLSIVIFYRMVFHHPIESKLLPTLFILFAPPAIGFISYVKLTGNLDVFARILYYFALFLLAFVLLQFDMFAKIKFYISWWAYSFPLAAITIATMLYYHLTALSFFFYASVILLNLLFLMMLLLLVRTFIAVIHCRICVEE